MIIIIFAVTLAEECNGQKSKARKVFRKVNLEMGLPVRRAPLALGLESLTDGHVSKLGR